MEIVKCIICDEEIKEPFIYAKDANSVFSQTFQLVGCKKCGLVYLNPRIKNAEHCLYVSGYYVDLKGGLANIVNFLDVIFQKIRTYKIIGFKDGGTILDVGCGEGRFLEQMLKLGWQCYGVETSIDACKLIPEKLKANISNKDLAVNEFPDSYFDVITFWHSLEHIANPILDLQKTNRIIKDDGLLFIAVPNIDSLEFKITKHRWFHLDAPRHLYHYTPKTITALLDKCGFTVLKISHCAFEYNIFTFPQSIINIVDINMDSFYRFLKHGKLTRGKHYTLSELYSIIIAILFNVILFAPSIFFAYFASILKQSAVIYVYAKKDTK